MGASESRRGRELNICGQYTNQVQSGKLKVQSNGLRMSVVALILVLLSLVVGREVYARLILPAPPLNFDEAAHSLEGYYILRDITRLDWHELWVNTNMQTLWPPGFSYLQAPFLALFGVTDNGARLFAYAMLGLTLLMGCVLAWQIDRRLAPIAALVGGLISLTAPGWLFTASWAMQETPVAFVVFCVFAVFLHALKKRGAFWFALTGAGLFCLFLTKYNYAAFALAAIGLVDVAERVRLWREKKESAGRLAITFFVLYLPLIAGVLFWFFGAQDVVKTEIKWRDFAFFVSNEDSGYPFWSEQNLLFYVRVAADWLMPSPWLAALALLSAGYAVVRARSAGARLLALFFAIGFALATIHQLKAPRYITPIFPSLWLLAGIGAAQLWQDVGQWRKSQTARISLIALLAIVTLAGWVTWLPRLQPVWAGDVAFGLRGAADQIYVWQKPERPLLIIGTFGELGPPYFEWRLRPVAAFAQSGKPIQYDAPPGDGTDIQRVQAWALANPGAQITTIKISSDSPLYATNDMQNKNVWKQKIVDEFSQVKGYTLVEQKTFSGGITVSYYLPN